MANKIDVEVFENAAIIGDGSGTNPDWPVVGAETTALKHTPDVLELGDAADAVVEEARRILKRGAPPEAQGQTVGLVTGYVQSGKTLSFTTVCALARDNGFPLVIILAGTKTNLFDQSNERLERELRLKTRSDRKWLHIPIDLNPAASPHARIGDALADWSDPSTPDNRRQAVLIIVMKHHRHLDVLVRSLSNLNLASVPAIVIDDEGDQAGLNALASRSRESPTYRQILRLRGCLPRHTYLQYTATPQAPLLINIIDALSPSFAEVLTPGEGYTGGQVFFAAANRYIRTIPATELFTATQTLSDPPPTYRLALASFFVGVAAGFIRDSGDGNRSMMVHPHQTRVRHNEYFVWAESLKASWASVLGAPADDEHRTQVEALMRQAHADLASTVADLPPFDDVLRELPRTIRRTVIWEVNSTGGTTPTIRWRDAYAHILVGGQAMDRGFTVKGLTVTYMPRGLGEGNADTVQQRARFFGYKERYLGYCRVWLEQVVRDAFEEYVEHEENMRQRLIDHGKSGRPLREWKRAFFLDQNLRPTRKQVLTIAYRRGNHGARWVAPTRPHELQEAIDQNNVLVERILARLTFDDDPGDARRTSSQRHRVADAVPLRQTYTDLLEELRFADPVDSLQHTALLLQIARWLESHPNATCSLYVMSPDATDRYRTRTKDEEVENFFQGANPSTGPSQGSIYPGDREIHHATDLTIQVHTVDLRPHKDSEDQQVYPRVSVVAIYVPAAMGKDWLVQ